MQVFIRTITGATLTMNVDAQETVYELKQRVSQQTGIPCEDIRFICGMSQLENEQTFAETGVEELSNIIMTLSLDGGKKKKKRKPHTTPKVIPHKHVTIKMRTLNYFEVTKDGKVNKLKKESNTNAGCYLADHKDRMHCGRTGQFMFYKLTKDGKRIDPVQNKPKRSGVAEVATGKKAPAKKKK